MIIYWNIIHKTSVICFDSQEAANNDNGKAPHSAWRNYDDFNEYFWWALYSSCVIEFPYIFLFKILEFLVFLTFFFAGHSVALSLVGHGAKVLRFWSSQLRGQRFATLYLFFLLWLVIWLLLISCNRSTYMLCIHTKYHFNVHTSIWLSKPEYSWTFIL